jgi:hypothetical protein
MLLVALSIILSVLLIVPIYNTFMIKGYLDNTKQKCIDIDKNDINLVNNINTLAMYILTLILLITIIKTTVIFNLHKN